jgi:glycerol-3-phosphate O-acyltransferase
MRAHARENGLDFPRLADAERRAAVQQLGGVLMQAIGQIVPVLPVPLVASVLLRDPLAALSELELKAEVNQLIASLEARGIPVYLPRADRDYAINVGLRMLLLRRLVQEDGGLLRPSPDELPLLRYYAYSIAHLLHAQRSPDER